MTDLILYEHPLNERIRVFIRLETIYSEIDELIGYDSPTLNRTVVALIGDLLSIIQRGDIKSEMLKELERHIATFSKLRESPDVDTDLLENYLFKLQEMTARIHSVSGQIGASLKTDEFLSSIIQRCGIPGGTCDFDLPSLHYWLTRPFEERLSLINRWLGELGLVKETTRLIMELTRSSALHKEAVAENGLHQQSLEKNHPCQLVRVGLPADETCFPEISGNKHHFTIRFMRTASETERPQQISESVPFKLGICII